MDRIIGWTLILWGIHKIDYPFLSRLEWFVPWGYLLTVVFMLIIALAVVFKYIYEKEKELQESLYRDKLTGLPRRSLLTERFGQLREENKSINLIVLDLNNFHEINEFLGYEQGDELLKKIGLRLKKFAGAGDDILLARLENDKFALLRSGNGGQQDLKNYLNKLREIVEKPFEIEKEILYINVQMGVSRYPEHGEKADRLIRNASIALTRARRQGNNYVIFNKDFTRPSLKNFNLSHHLREALEKEQFELYYQPKVRVKDKKILGVEALIRWNHPRQGFLEPGEFIGLAEKTGLILKIDRWVLARACREVKDLQKKGYDGLRLAVNFSALHFNNRDFPQEIAKILRQTEFDPTLLEVEITERVFVRNFELTTSIIQKLKELGVNIAIDDFGSGYSSFNYLKKLLADIIKVDRSFIRNIDQDEKDRLIASTIITLAHELNYEVTAEGVETEEQFKLIQQSRCNAVQGYYTGRPRPLNHF